MKTGLPNTPSRAQPLVPTNQHRMREKNTCKKPDANTRSRMVGVALQMKNTELNKSWQPLWQVTFGPATAASPLNAQHLQEALLGCF